MKKLLLILLPVFALVVVGGGLWWRYGRVQDPFAHAQLLMDKGDLQGALLELRGIVRVNPQNVTAHFPPGPGGTAAGRRGGGREGVAAGARHGLRRP